VIGPHNQKFKPRLSTEVDIQLKILSFHWTSTYNLFLNNESVRLTAKTIVSYAQTLANKNLLKWCTKPKPVVHVWPKNACS